MGEVMLWKLADVVLTLVQFGLTRDSVVNAVKDKEDAGATPAQVLAFLHDMRDAAQATAHKAVADKLAGK